MGQPIKEFVPTQPETLFALTPNGVEDALKFIRESKLEWKGGGFDELIDFANDQWRKAKESK